MLLLITPHSEQSLSPLNPHHHQSCLPHALLTFTLVLWSCMTLSHLSCSTLRLGRPRSRCMVACSSDPWRQLLQEDWAQTTAYPCLLPPPMLWPAESHCTFLSLPTPLAHNMHTRSHDTLSLTIKKQHLMCIKLQLHKMKKSYAWIDLEINMLREISQLEKDRLHSLTYMRNLMNKTN